MGSKEHLQSAIVKESRKFEESYLWLEKHMPPKFFEEVGDENLLLVVHNLMEFDLQDFFSHIHLKHTAIAMCLDSPDADLRILKQYRAQGIHNYRAFVSDAPPPFQGVKGHLRIAVLLFTGTVKNVAPKETPLPQQMRQEVFLRLKERNSQVTEKEFHQVLDEINQRFLRSLTKERLIMALDMYFRAKTRDACQYEARYNHDWKEKKGIPSLQIVLAWRNVPKYNFLYRIAKIIHRHGLVMKKVNASDINPYSSNSVLILSLGLDGMRGGAAWEEADIDDFLKELVTCKYFEGDGPIDSIFVDTGLVRGNLSPFIKTMVNFVHQGLVHFDSNLYSYANIEEGFCRHPELTVLLTQIFEWKFHPERKNLKEYEKSKDNFLSLIDKLDTGHEINDQRRKNIFRQGLHFIDFSLKTNFYRNNKTALSFRLDPVYLDKMPYDRKEKFPLLPYAIFFIKGSHFLAFHIRFMDLARGGIRTVFPEKKEQMLIEKNVVFAECYGLAFTQQKKNKDIPEGGGKAVIFLESQDHLFVEEEIFKKELERAEISEEEIQSLLKNYRKEQRVEFLFSSQRSFIESLLTLVNCHPDGTLKAKHVVDYLRQPEYLYLGPDENMFNEMIVWISEYSVAQNYKPGRKNLASPRMASISI